MERRLISETEAAPFIGMSRQFLRKSRMNGNLPNHTPAPPFIRIGRAIRYDIQDLEAWIARHRCMVPGSDGVDHK